MRLIFLPMKHMYRLVSISLLFLGLFFSSLAQDSSIEDEVSYEGIPISKIPDYQFEATAIVYKIDQFMLDTIGLFNLEKGLQETRFALESNKHVFDSLDINQLNTDQLQKWDRKWINLENGINSIYTPIDEKLVKFNEYFNELDILYQIWLQTSIDIKNRNIPSNLKESVLSTKIELRTLRSKIKENEAYYLSLKYDCNALINKVVENRNEISLAQQNIVKNLLVAEQPVIWKSFFEYYQNPSLKVENHLFTNAKDNAVNYLRENPTIIYLSLLVFVFVLISIVYIQKYLKEQQILKKIESSASIVFIRSRPIILSFFVSWIVTLSVFYLPIEIKSIFQLVMLLPIIFAISDIFGKQKTYILAVFGFYYLLRSLKFLLDQEYLIVRMGLIIVTLLSIFIIWFIVNKSKFISRFNKWKWVLQLVLNFNLLMLVVALLFLIIGNVYLGKMLLIGSIGMVLLGILFSLIYKFYSAILSIFFVLPIVQKSNIVKLHTESIISFLQKVAGVVFIILWVNIALNDFAVKSKLYDFLLGIFNYQWTVGATSFGLNSIFAFIFTIYCSIWFSRILLALLHEEVFARAKTDKGMSSTITLLLRYSLIGLGFLFALAAAGIELEKISIIIGALGVGIGFGLQNIFNNLFSGIILALERPIRVDDIIQVGELTGVVKEIGFRASIVRTYDGSDVIVPNGDIISNQMINWTHSDRKRRLKIDLGVSYNSDPEEVIAILKELTADHPMVESNPAPRPRFLGFGESTLDFQLLFWITDFDNSFGVGTEITIKLHKKLKERGIEIPYPKRDITITRELEK